LRNTLRMHATRIVMPAEMLVPEVY
jgi:hypothetical protein